MQFDFWEYWAHPLPLRNTSHCTFTAKLIKYFLLSATLAVAFNFHAHYIPESPQTTKPGNFIFTQSSFRHFIFWGHATRLSRIFLSVSPCSFDVLRKFLKFTLFYVCITAPLNKSESEKFNWNLRKK